MKPKQLKFLAVWLAMLSSTACFAWDFVLEPFNKSSEIYKPVSDNSTLTLTGYIQGISLPAGGSALFRILVPPGISLANISAEIVSNNEYAMVGVFTSEPITISPDALKVEIPYLNQILYEGVPLTEPTYIYFVLYHKSFTNSLLYIPIFTVNMLVQDKNLYMAWLNGNGETCSPATIDADLNLHIPSLTYNGLHLSADLSFKSITDNKRLFEVVKYDLISSVCSSASLSPEFKLHIPTAVFNNNKLWADLLLYSSNNDKFIFELTDYGSIP